MAVVTLGEHYEGRKGGIDRSWYRQYTRTFRAVCDNPFDGPATVGADPRLPRLGQAYRVPGSATEFDNGSFCSKVEVTNDGSDGGFGWLVTCEYGPYDPTQWPENPLDHPIKINWSWSQFERIVDEDINGNAVVNAAGDYFDPPLVRDDSRPLLAIVRNEQNFTSARAGQFKDAVNSDSWFGYAPKQVKCSNISASLEYNPICGFYYIVSYEFAINTESTGWQKEILNQGLRYLNGSTRTNVLINGAPATAPVPLDNSGAVLPPSGTPVFLAFDIYPEVSFSGLGFDFAGAPGQS